MYQNPIFDHMWEVIVNVALVTGIILSAVLLSALLVAWILERKDDNNDKTL